MLHFRGSHSSHQMLGLLGQATFYLTYARRTIGNDRGLALVMCDDAEEVLSRVKSPSSRSAEDQELRAKLMTAYIDLGNLQKDFGNTENATASFNKAEKLKPKASDSGQATSKRKSAPAVDTPQAGPSSQKKHARDKDIAELPQHIFATTEKRSIVELKLPEADERLNNTQQLAYCLGLIQASGFPDIALRLRAREWLQPLESEEKDRLKKLATEVVRIFKLDEMKTAKIVAEVTYLAPVLDKDVFRDLLRHLFMGIEKSNMLDVHLLEGLARMVQSVDPCHVDSDDMVKILELFSNRLRNTHTKSEHIYLLTLTVSQVLDAMVDAEIKDLNRENIHLPLTEYLDELKKSSDPYLIYQAAYAYQALLCVPDNETMWGGVRRRAWSVIQGVSGMVSAVKGLDLVKFIEGLENIHQGIAGAAEVADVVVSAIAGVTSLAESGQSFLECLKESFSSKNKKAWYLALRGADTLIRDGDYPSFKRLVCQAPCRRDPAFLWGVCQRLGDIAADPARDDDTVRGAIEFLIEIYQKDDVWGKQTIVKQWIINILRQLASPSGNDQLRTLIAGTLLQELEEDKDATKKSIYQECYKEGPIPYPLKVALPAVFTNGQDDIGSLSLLDRAQNRPNVESNIRALRRQRLKERGNNVYIPPLAKSSLQATDDTRFPLMDKVEKFLGSDQKVFLLLGDSGAGKSTFSSELECVLWQSYNNNSDRIPLRINLPAIDKPEQDMIAKQLRKAEFTEPQIRELKHHHKFILICDGYDECQQTQNLYMSNRLNQPGEWSAQMVISCRTEYLGSDYRDRFQPGDRNKQSDPSSFQEAVILPFSLDQVHAYIQQYVSRNQPLWRAEDYRQALELIPSLKDLVKNPFLMALSLEVLPRMVDPGETLSTTRLTRVALYDEFIEQWLERGKKRLGEQKLSPQARAAFDSLSDEGFSQHGIDFFKRLAVAIYKEQKGYPIVKYMRTKDEKTWKSEFFSRDEEKFLLREACPLTRSGNQYRFIHRSLLEYGLARAVFDPQEWSQRAACEMTSSRRGSVSSTFSFDQEAIEESEPAVTKQVLDPESPLIWKSFVHEPSILQFLEERVHQVQEFKEQLLAYIDYSKTDKKWRIAAANAITILVRAGIQLIGADLKGIQIPGADLSYGVFDSAQLQGADLRKVSLRGVWLRQADLGGAHMKGVQFGELPFLKETDKVHSCTYSPNGTSFAVGLRNGLINVYETSSWELTFTLSGHTEEVRSIMYSPEGDQIASASQDNTIKLWDATTGVCQRTLGLHYRAVNCITYSPQGDQIASAGDDMTLKIWGVATGSHFKDLTGHADKVTCVVYSPNGNQIGSASLDNTIRLWDVYSGDCSHILSGHSNKVSEIAYSPQGDQIASASEDKTVRLWNVETGACCFILSGHTSSVQSVAYSPEGDQIASGSDDGTVRLWSVEAGTCRHVLTGHSRGVSSVVYSPKGDRVASGSMDKTVRLWDVSVGASRYISSGHSMAVMSVKCSPHGGQIATCSLDSTIRLWDVRTGSCHRTIRGHTGQVNSVAYSPWGDQIASGSSDRSVRLWNVETGVCQLIWEGHSDLINCVAYSPHGNQVVSASNDKTLRLWDVMAGTCLKVLADHTEGVLSVAYSPGGMQIASGSKDHTVRLWDLVAGSCCHVLSGHLEDVRSVVYSPQGNRLASASDDKTVRVWNVGTGDDHLVLSGHLGGVTSVLFSPNGELIASGSLDKTVRLWNLKIEQCLSVVQNFQDPVKGIAWNKATLDTNYLITGCGDGSVLMWEIGDEADLCSMRPCWSSTNGALIMTGASIHNVHGLSPLNKQLLEQRGAVGAPVPLLRDLGNKVISMVSAVSRFKAGLYPTATANVQQRDRSATI